MVIIHLIMPVVLDCFLPMFAKMILDLVIKIVDTEVEMNVRHVVLYSLRLIFLTFLPSNALF
jgi:hypothetical protein